MKLNWTSTLRQTKSIVALGTFDGVHLGHQQLLQHTVDLAAKHQLTSVAFTFDQPPEQFFTKQQRLLTDFPTKQQLLLSYGMDCVAWVNFDQEFAKIQAEDFITDILLNELNAAGVVCGYNYRFGHHATGNVQLLQEVGTKHGLLVKVVPPYLLDEQPVSSTRIRQALTAGDVYLAARLLGRYHSYHGKVTTDKRLGRDLGFPTANIHVNREIVVPRAGAYFTWCFLEDGSNYPAMSSVSTDHLIESYLIGFSGNLYNQHLRVVFLQHLREWQHFHSLADLRAQLRVDYQKAISCVNKYRLQGDRIVLE